MEMLIYLFFQVVEDEDKPYNEQNINDLLVKKKQTNLSCIFQAIESANDRKFYIKINFSFFAWGG